MNTKNTFVKKLTALVLCLCMVLPMVTTGFAPMMALLDGIAPQADAAVTEKGKVAFYVPEVIYLYPEARSSAQATATPFQYYVENTVNTSSIYTQPTPNTTLNNSGTLYFAAENGFSDVSVSTRFVDASGNTISDGSVTVGSFSNKTSYGTFAVTAGTSPSLAAATTGCYLEWTVSYTNNAGERQSAIAYTYVYKPYIYPVATGSEAGTGTSGGANWASNITWISGIHSITPVATSQGNSFDKSWFNHYTKENFASFISKDKVGYVNGTRYESGSQAKVTSGFTTAPSSTGGSLGYTVFSGTSGTGNYLQIPSDSNPGFAASGSAVTYSPPSGTYNFHAAQYRANKKDIQTAVYGKSYGNLYIDTSRYSSNLNQIPNLAVGMMVTDDEDAKGGTGNWYVADFTGRGTDYFNKWYEGSGNSSTLYNDRGTVIAAQSNGNYDRSYDTSEGIRYAGAWPRALTGSTNTAGATAVYRVKGFYANMDSAIDGNYDAQSHSLCEMKATYYNKSTLRTAVNNAINFMGTLGLKAEYGSHYYDTNFTAWQTFKSAYRAAAMGLTKLDGSVDVDTLATNLNNAVNALKNNLGQHRKIFFDVNYNGIKPNLFVLNNVTTAGGVTVTMDGTEKLTLNGTLSANGNYATAAFSPLVNTPYRINIDVQSGSLSTNASCLVWEYENANGGQLSPRQNYDIGDAQDRNYNHTFTATDATAIDKAVFWGYKGTSLSVNNYQAYIKIEQGSTNTTYSPAARIATDSGTYGDLPDLADYNLYPQLHRTGYIFKGWATTPTGTTAVTTDTAVTSQTLYAIWEPNTYTIYLEGNGSTGGATQNMTVKYDQTVTLNANGYTKNGYTFTGWNTAADGSGTAYADKASVKNLRSGVQDTISLYAQWEPIQYALKYDVVYADAVFPAGTTGYTKVDDTTYKQAYDIEDDFYLLPAPSLTGYTFNYWKIKTADGTWQPVGETGAGGEHVEPNQQYGNPEIVADWTANTYTLTFDAMNGTVSPASKTVTFDAAYGDLPTPARDGYTFDGWYLEAACTNKITANSIYKIADNSTVYAKWTADKQNLTVNTDGGSNTTNLIYVSDGTFNPDGTATFSGGDAASITYRGNWYNDYKVEGEYVASSTASYYQQTAYLPLWVYLESGKTYELTFTSSVPNTHFYFMGGDENNTHGGTADNRFAGTPYARTKVGDNYQFTGTFICGDSAGLSDAVWENAANPTGYYQLRLDFTYGQDGADNVSHAYTVSNISVKEVSSEDGGDPVNIYRQPTDTKITLTDPVKGGYDFLGWKTSDGTITGTGAYTCTFAAGGETLIATWGTKEYTLTFNADGGTGVSDSLTYTAESTDVLPEPTKAGYTFLGWKVESTDGNWPTDVTSWFFGGDPITGFYGDTTLIAIWEANEYTITFDSDGGTAVDSITAACDEAITAPANPTKPGYTFAGWSPALPATMPAGGLNVKAQWTVNQYTITFDTDGGSAVAPITQDFGTAVTAPANPTKEGYTFAGWDQAIPSYMPDADMTVKAKWTINQYTITFDTDGGSAVAPITQDFGTAVTAPADPTKTGYTFAGWSPAVPATMPAANTTLKALWTIDKYTFTYIVDGVQTVTEYEYNAVITKPTDPEKEGHTFAGWSPVIPDKMPANDVTVTATWNVNDYTVTYIVDDETVHTDTYSYGAAVTAYTYAKRGYTFSGWNVTVPATMPAENLTFTGTTTVNTYTVTATLNGGSIDGDSNPYKVTYTVENAAFTLPTPVKTGYTFDGWTGANGDTAQKLITIDPAQDKFLADQSYVANWTANTNTEYKVYTYYMGTDGAYGEPAIENKTGTTGELVTITPATVSGFTATQTTVSDYIKADGSLILNVYYQRNKYAVTLNKGTGIEELSGAGEYFYGVQVNVGVAKYKDGYSNAVWTYTETETQASTSFTMPDNEVNLTATATADSYTISYDLAGGTVAGTNPTSYTVETATFTLVNPTRTGYTFAGWTGTGLDAASTSVTVAKGSTEPRAYTATWTPVVYDITYNLNGGSLADGVTNPENYTIETENFTLTNPTKVGYAFAGWTGTDLDSASTAVTVAKGSTGARAYTATWTESNANYNVIYYIEDLNADTYSQYGETQTVGSTTGEKIVLDTLKTTIEGFTFKEATDKDGIVLTADPTVAADGSTVIKLYYTRNSHTLTYYITKGENETAVSHQAFENVEFGATIPTVADPVRTGYSFLGWKDIDTIPTMPDSDLDILALWDPNVFNISYELDGGAFADGVTVPATHTYDTTTDIPNPEKLGYAFAGWTANGNALGTDYTVKENDFTADFTLTATWTPVEQNYTVEFYFMDTKGENYVLDASKTKTGKLATGSELELTPAEETGFSLNTEKTVLDTPMPPEGNLVLKVYYDRNQYKLTLVAGDGIASVPVEQSYYYQAAVSFTASMKTGYAWSKWTNTADGSDYSATQNQAFTMPASDLSLTANATPISYTITVDTVGGTLVSDFTKDSYIVTDENITVPNATKPGYIFNGWSLNGAAAKTDLTIDPANAVNVALVASWTAEEYTIIYKGIENAVNTNPATYTIETETFSLVEPTKTGYEFLGWTFDGQTTPTKDVTIEKGSMGNLEFTANWNALGIEYKVTLRFEGQTANNFDSFDETKLSAAADSQVTAAQVAPVREGFTYAYAMQNGAKVETFTVAADGTTEIELYYTRNSYKITFDADGGEAAVAEQSYKYGADVVAPADPTKTGYTFAGWSPALPATMPAENIEVTATWTVNSYTITFNTDGGTEIAAITKNYGESVGTVADPTRTGYTFDGWYVNDVKVEVPATMPAENMTLTAKWNINSYTITFNTDGGTEVAAITKNYGEPVGTVSAPTKTGYTFDGWDVEIPATMPANDLTVTAQWTINQYTITFNTDGGTAIEAIRQDYNTAVTAPANPTKTGYTFAGWDVAIPATMPANDLTVTAQWTINQYTITFYDADGQTVLHTVKQDYNTAVDTTYRATKTGYEFVSWDKAIPATMPAEDTAITASWKAIEYKIIYNGLENAENHPKNPENYTIEDTVTLLAPNKVGYTFAGWSGNGIIGKGSTGDKTFTASWTANTDTEYTVNYWLQPVDGSTDLNSYVKSEKSFVGTGTTATTAQITLADIAGFTKPQETAEIYIKADGSAVADYYYTRNQYTVTFDTLGGSDIGMATYYYSATVKAPENNPTKTGYTFDGWDTLPETMPAQNITVKAIWTANSYEIKYEGLENAEAFAQVTAHTYGTDTKIEKPERKGYTFAGWLVNDSVTPVVDLTLGATAYTADITLEATWTPIPQKYTVVYYYENLNGEYVETRRETENKAPTDSPVTLTPAATETGFTLNTEKSRLTGNIPVPGTTLELSVYYDRDVYTLTWVVESVTVKTETYKYEQPIVKPADPVKEGYTFGGWNPADIATMPAEDLTLTAQFIPNENTAYKVVHLLEDLNADTFTAKETENLNGKTESEVTPAVKSYEGFKSPEAQTVTIKADGSTVVEYKYTRNSYTVTIDASAAGLSEATATKPLEYGDKLTVTATLAAGYKFEGWKSSDETLVANNENLTFTIESIPAGDVTLTAATSLIEYTISYNYDGGALAAGESNVESFNVTTDDFTLINPTKRGYDFLGWIGSNGDTPEQTVTIAKGSVNNRTYTAKWQVKNYTISYELDGGTVAVANPTGYNVNSLSITLNNPTKPGYEFAGWTGTDLDGAVKNVTIPAGSVENRSYKATWTPKTQTYYVDLYFMDLNGEYPETPKYHYDYTAQTATDVTYTMPDETGFTIVGDKVLTGTIPATDLESEALVLKGYYKRDQHTVTLASGEGIASVSGAETYYFGASVTVKAELMPGYAWVNWSDANGTYADQEYTFTMGTADVSLTANAQIINYTISYNLDGGSVAAANPDTYTVNTETFTLNNPTRTGYTFLGWTGSNGTAPQMTVAIEKGWLGNRSYTANWSVNEYTLTIDPNGGIYNGNPEKTVRDYTVNETITLDTPTRVGYTFAGWSDGTNTYDSVKLENATGDRTYTAQWSANSNIKYTVEHYKMNLNGEYDLIATDTTVYENGVADGTVTPPVNAYTGFTSPEAQPVTVNPDGSTKVVYKYTRNQYKLTYNLFGGATSEKTYFYGAVVDTAPATNVEGYTFAGWDKETPTHMPAGDLEITGTWNINQYTITFANTGDTVIAPMTQDYGTAIVAPANPTRTGYTFAGWDTEIPATMPAENMTITANWTVNSYTITFNTDGGSAVAPITQDFGTAITAPADPTKTGYTFGGWNVPVPATMPAENMTITALWNINQYTVTFNTDGGTAIESVTADYGTPIAKPADPTKRGYTFKGWDAEIPATVPAENVTINAKWEINTYTITYINPNGSLVVDGKTNPTTYTVESTIKLNELTWAGYSFSGWVYRLDGQDSETTLENDTITNMVGNLTLRSMWSANKNDWYVDVYYMNTDGSYSNTPDTVLTNPSGSQQFTGYDVAYDLYDSRTLLAGFTPDTANSITTGIIPGTGELHLIAKYKRNQYTVTYDFANDQKNKVVTDYFDKDLAPVADPTRTGYTFAGWYDAKGNKVDLPETMPLDGGTYTAHWSTDAYTLTLDANGGTAVENIDYNIESASTLPAVTRNGYYFQGWLVTTADGSWVLNDNFAAGTSVNGNFGNATLTAQWTEVQYTLSFNTVGGSVDPTFLTYTISDATQVLPTPVRPGYAFDGWLVTETSCEENDSGLVYWVVGETYPAGKAVKDTYGNATFEAQWTARTFTVATEMSNIDYVGNTTATVDVDYSATLTPAAGYELPETITVTIGDKTAVVNTDYTWTIHADGSATLTLVGASIIDNVTIKVDRKIITYTISYSGLENSTLDAENKHSYTVETDTFTLNNPKKVGYTFLGWTGTALANAEQTVTIEKGSVGNRAYTAIWQANLNDCTVEHYQQNIYDNEYTLVTADTKTVQIETDKYFEPAVNTYTGFKAPAAQRIFVKGDGAVTVKYYYDREVYNVSLDGTMEGVASVSGAGEYRYGYELTVNATVNSGYAWAGWTNADGTVVSAAPDYTITIGTADVALTANASIIEYTIAYDLDGGTATNPATYTVTTDTFTLNNPTREGYDFAGWVGSNGTTPSTVVTIANGSVGDKEYTAKWTPIVYTVSYELHNGTPQGDMPTTYTIEDATVILQDPVRNGYDFLGWIGSNGDTPEKNVSFAGGSIGNLSFEAVWQVQTHYYKVETYIMTTDGQYLNTPDAETDPIASETDQEIVLTPDAKTGFTVDETLSKLTGVVDYKDELVLKIYYARNQYELNLTIDGNGITAVSPVTKQVYYGAETEILATVADGYTFAKWTSDTDKVEDSTKNPHKFVMPDGNVTLTATATLNTYNINYALNEGTNHADNKTTYTVLDTVVIKQPTRLGYTFTGWSGDYTGTDVITIPAGTTGDINLSANWQINNYAIAYNLDGGQLTDGKTNPTSYTVLDSFTLNNPEKVGYSFEGWKGTVIDGIQKDVTVNANKDTTGDLVFTAVWTANTDTKYTVNYWLMDIPSDGGVKTYTKDENASFVGTFTSDMEVTPHVPAYAGFKTADAQSKKVAADGSTVFNFYYERNIYTYTFQAVGYEDIIREYYYDYPVTAPENPSRAGYKFTGWSPVVADKMPANNVVSIAQWNPLTYSIGYALGGGTAVGNPVSYNIETATFTLNQPTKYGYTFVGWTGSNGDTKELNVEIAVGSMGDRSYTAHWEPTRYAITYNLDGGSDNGANPLSYTIEETVTLVNPVKPGYRFLGWKGTGIAGISSYVTFREQTGDRTYTAQWTVSNNTPYTVRHHQQNIGADTYTLFEEEALTGTTLSTVIPQVKTYPGFTSPVAETLTILPDGSAAVDYYYTRNNYTIHFDSNGGTPVASQTYAFGETVVPPAAPSFQGYTFAGWTPALPETMTAGNLYLTASWAANTDTPYTVYHYYQDTDCVSYPDSLMETEYCHGETGAVVEVATRDKEGFTSPAKRTIVIAADGSRTVRYYYTRNTYTVTFVDHNDNILDLQSVVYGLPATPPVLADRAPDADGHYEFLGWSEDISFIHGYTTIKAMYKAEAHNPGMDADCTQALICTICNYEIAPANGHMPVVQIPAVEPTCDTPGNTADSVCSVCGEVLSKYKVLPALGHDIGSWYVDVPATTTETGVLKRVCSRCDWFETHEIPVLSDTPVVSIDITTSGSQAYVGTTYQLVTSIKPSNAGNKQVIWESSDPSVASVTQDGMITSHKPGEVTFTVTTLDGLKTDSITINFFYSADNYNLIVLDLFACDLVMNGKVIASEGAMAEIIRVKAGDTLAFTLNPTTAEYLNQGGYILTANGSNVAPDANGVYYIYNVHENIEISALPVIGKPEFDDDQQYDTDEVPEKSIFAKILEFFERIIEWFRNLFR